MTARRRQGIFVPLLDKHRAALIDLADREWWRVEDQAAKILIEGLQREGVLPEPSNEHPNMREGAP
jgi:hypothetical protein